MFKPAVADNIMHDHKSRKGFENTADFKLLYLEAVAAFLPPVVAAGRPAVLRSRAPTTCMEAYMRASLRSMEGKLE